MKFQKIKISEEEQKLISDFMNWEDCPIELDYRQVMAIAVQIEMLDDADTVVDVQGTICTISGSNFKTKVDVYSKIDSVLKAIIRFINFYDYQWTCVDPSSDRYGRHLTETTFEFKEDGTQAVIDLTEYSDKQKQDILDAYSFKLVDTHNWIIAECIFETEKAPARSV
jgi:hypothetical protein